MQISRTEKKSKTVAGRGDATSDETATSATARKCKGLSIPYSNAINISFLWGISVWESDHESGPAAWRDTTRRQTMEPSETDDASNRNSPRSVAWPQPPPPAAGYAEQRRSLGGLLAVLVERRQRTRSGQAAPTACGGSRPDETGSG